MTGTTTPVLIAVDWGTSNARAYLVDAERRTLDSRQAESGVGRFTDREFERTFQDLTAGWPDVPVYLCGMIGSRQGWVEAPYVPCPAGFRSLCDNLIEMQSGNRTIHVVPGIRYRSEHGEYDVMRGEETQILGLFSIEPDFAGTVILPGTHSKWSRLKDRCVQTFKTFMTGEMFQLLCDRSMLRPAVSGAEKMDMSAFENGVKNAETSDGRVLGDLFPIRAGSLLADTPPAQSRSYLSGLLIGAELAGARQAGYLDAETETIVIGAGSLARLYGAALKHWSVPYRSVSGDTMAIDGLVELAESRVST